MAGPSSRWQVMNLVVIVASAFSNPRAEAEKGGGFILILNYFSVLLEIKQRLRPH
jgi:hypothetical protein